ncbi:hypothetical protein WJ752_004605, partial [Salmonella enterica]
MAKKNNADQATDKAEENTKFNIGPEATGEKPEQETKNNINRRQIGSGIQTNNEGEKTGGMSDNVGVGKHAQTNIIWYIISSTFIVFSCIAAALVILVVYGYNISEVTQSIKDIWSVFTPILTLSLGYLFGKQ